MRAAAFMLLTLLYPPLLVAEVIHVPGDEPSIQAGIDGNISTHPLFCDREAGDFSLALGSPCLPENNDCGELMGAFGLGCEFPTSAEEAAAASFPAPELGQNRPNPFNPSTVIPLRLAEPARIWLSVHDIAGKRVRDLVMGTRQEAGERFVTWDGRDDAGASQASGVYLARLEAAGHVASIRMILLK